MEERTTEEKKFNLNSNEKPQPQNVDPILCEAIRFLVGQKCQASLVSRQMRRIVDCAHIKKGQPATKAVVANFLCFLLLQRYAQFQFFH